MSDTRSPKPTQRRQLPYGSTRDNAHYITQAHTACSRLRKTAALYGVSLPPRPIIDDTMPNSESLHLSISDMCALYTAAYHVLVDDKAPPLIVPEVVPPPEHDPDNKIFRRNETFAGARYVTVAHALVWGVSAAEQVILKRQDASTLPAPPDLPSMVRSIEFYGVGANMNDLLTVYAGLPARRSRFGSTLAFFRDMEHAVLCFLLATTGRISNIPHSAKCFLYMGHDTTPTACVQTVHVAKAASAMFRDLVALAHEAKNVTPTM